MTEKFRPQPENPIHNAPEAGDGSFPPPGLEQQPHGGGSRNTELDLPWQAEEGSSAQMGSESTSGQPKTKCSDPEKESDGYRKLMESWYFPMEQDKLQGPRPRYRLRTKEQRPRRSKLQISHERGLRDQVWRWKHKDLF
jgi:hypothetical protein